MTVIAYKDGVLAADSLVTSGYDLAGHIVKIRQEGEWSFGVAGSPSGIVPITNWVKGGADLDTPIEFPSSLEATALLINSHGEVYYVDSDSHYPVKMHVKYAAVGSGSTAARTAMFLGHSAIEAVEAVTHVDSSCGGSVTWVAIDGSNSMLELS